MNQEPLTWLWMRHPRPKVGQGYIYGGMEDVPLNVTGSKTRQAFEAITDFLPQNLTMISSPSPRAQTALQHILKRRENAKTPVTIDKRFIEQSFGDWSGKNTAELAEDPDFISYIQNPMNITPPHGESVSDMFKRVHDAINDYNQRYKNGELQNSTILVSGHGGVSRAALALASGDLSESFKQKIQRLSLCHTEWNPQINEWTIHAKNMTIENT